MSAFNTLHTNTECGSCSKKVPMKVQFKFGDTWQEKYQIGERIRWGGNDIGQPGYRRVVVDGAGEPCPRCGFEGDFVVVIENGVISAVEKNAGRYDFVGQDEAYIVTDK